MGGPGGVRRGSRGPAGGPRRSTVPHLILAWRPLVEVNSSAKAHLILAFWSPEGYPQGGPGSSREAIWDPRKSGDYNTFYHAEWGSGGGGGSYEGFVAPPLHSRAANIKLKLRSLTSFQASGSFRTLTRRGSLRRLRGRRI